MTPAAKRRLRPVTVYFEPAQLEALAKLSRLTRVPKAVYIRDALDLLLAGDGAIARYGRITMEVINRKPGRPKFIKAFPREAIGLPADPGTVKP